MQIRKGLLTILLIVFVFFQQCSKSDRSVPSQLGAFNSVISLRDAQEWFVANIQQLTNGRSSSNVIGIPAWHRTREVQVMGGGGILKVALEKYSVRFGYRDLLFQQRADGTILSLIQQVHADSAYLALKITAESPSMYGVRHYIRNVDFSGDVIYIDPATNHFLYGWRYQNGQAKFRLKPKLSDTHARLGGGPINNDDTTDEGGGPGWTGTGNNTDGYTIDGPEIVAPAPSNSNPPPFIPAATDPGPVNPPTIPVGGGSQSGGNSGPKENLKADDNYENDGVTVAAIPCKNSYNFVKQGNWQTAVITGYYFELYESGTGITYDLQIGTIETGMPAITYDGSLIQASVAQAMSTQAARNAERSVGLVINAFVLINPGTTPAQIRNNPIYINMFKAEYAEEINRFLRADYGYREDAHPATVSTNQATFVLNNTALWIPLKFVGRDCRD